MTDDLRARFGRPSAYEFGASIEVPGPDIVTGGRHLPHGPRRCRPDEHDWRPTGIRHDDDTTSYTVRVKTGSFYDGLGRRHDAYEEREVDECRDTRTVTAVCARCEATMECSDRVEIR